ncbi:MAG: protein translocase subunit SecF [Candidatus Aminicenantes bacterium]|nr:protein translocase subunit SecF [Candidatus Aminicenantes bacterium]
MQIFKKTPNIPFLKYKWIALAVTLVIVVAGLINILVGKGLKLGVDFGEGTLIRVMFKEPVSVSEVRKLLSEVGLGDSIIQEAGKESREFQIRTMEKRTTTQDQEIESHQILADRVIQSLQGEEDRQKLAQGLLDLNNIDRTSLTNLLRSVAPDEAENLANKIVNYRTENGIIASWDELSREPLNLPGEVTSLLQNRTFLGKMTVLSRETVGPQVGKDLRKKATQAIIWSLIGMLVYIALRFKGVEYGAAAIFTLAQDVLITMSIYSFTPREINLPIIAGLLTIVGFSINDTIVIFDRIRELQRTMRKEKLENIMNLSLNLNLSRTLITSGTVFLTVLSLYIFGGQVINDFAFLMLIGTIEGVYSTIFLSCPVVLFWNQYFKKKKLHK